ncbi:hypothetical protein [uncultured Parabacteroides sp.]|uniref:hypothetical protein n=1 Tax=uncultured Parabacteroides sp. TaxID=512312 RepID=UPI002599E319|nr:hypothetical protein [uncultured Parabacteroides sp.]
MEIKKRIDYKELSQAPFETIKANELSLKMLVYTGKKEEERPVFRRVIALTDCKVRIGTAGKEYWGIVGMDEITGESQWYNYNDCVSLENWAVLDRLLKKRFGWMEIMDPGLVYETKILAKSMLVGEQ